MRSRFKTQDVDGTRPDNIRTVFCSQAAVLCLRECCDPDGENGELVKKLQQMNSRLVNPEALHQLVMEHGHVVTNEKLFAGLL